jgi:hypothetical protein
VFTFAEKSPDGGNVSVLKLVNVAVFPDLLRFIHTFNKTAASKCPSKTKMNEWMAVRKASFNYLLC